MSSFSKKSHLPLKITPWFTRALSQNPTPLLRLAPLRGILEVPRFTSISVSAFSTRGSLLNTEVPGNGPSNPRLNAKKTESEHEDPFSTPSVSLESLGIGRNMKLFLLAVLSIFGTIETWFWCKAIWIWWKGGEIKEEGE
jgi:hypothetical protein